MLPLTGYSDRISIPPGGRIEFKVSSTFEEPYGADLVRIIHADPNPDGPGLKLEAVAAGFAGDYPSRHQPVRLGSYGIVENAGGLDDLADFTIAATIWPTLPGAPQAVISQADEDGRSFALSIGAEGASFALTDANGTLHEVSVGKAVRNRFWYRIWASFEAQSGRLAIHQRRLSPRQKIDDEGSGVITIADPALPRGGPLLIAARRARQPVEHFNGKIERPFVAAASLDEAAVERAARGEMVDGLRAAWNFSLGIDGLDIHDAGPARLHGRLVNLPARGMKGSNWSGREMCWRHAPGEYGAIHFHDDDIHDCGWETDFAFEAPASLRSGVYGARLRCRGIEEIIPFYVRPETGKPTARIAVLAATFTHQIYANYARGTSDQAYYQRVEDWGAPKWNPDEHKDYGCSTYNFHSDGSGICYSSRLRPIITIRPGFLSFLDPRGSGLRHFPADTHLTDWLEVKGHAYDVVTDDDLDEAGAALLAPYRVLLTGSHPEYHTEASLDAIQDFVDGGGNLMYLGGNGFYWRVARSEKVPGVLEIRRGEGGIRAWAADPGEYYNALDGAYGGLWRRNDRPPQQLCGVGFSAQGAFEGAYYVRAAGAEDPRAAWIFEGVEDEIIGNFGLSGGGAAGFELDRMDHRLGSPENAIVVASSTGHQESHIVVPEELLTHRSTWSFETHQELVRADMTYFETPAGGAVFSVGSITFCGSLSHDGYDNNVSRIIDNVLTRFATEGA